jgi:diguanylate cyclase (GGDEF)-like protein
MSDTGDIHMGIRARKILIALTVAALCVHVVAVVKFGSAPAGAFLSDFIQLALGLMLVPLAWLTAKRSTGVARHYWRLTALAYSLWDIAQILGTVQDMFGAAQHLRLIGFLFYFWYVPIGMVLFLDPESDSISLDRSALVDLIQGLLFLVTAYLYFILLSVGTQAVTDLASELRKPYLVVHSLIALSFLIRGWLDRGVARRFLGRMGLFLLFSCGVDVLYYYGPGKLMQTGEWFDLLWTVLLIIPLLIAITWNEKQLPERKDDHQAKSKSQLVTQIFSLVFPALILLMAAQISRSRALLASSVLVASFACSSARLLLTQKRLLAAQEALRREATHDGLTSIWNHAAILGILDRELVRAERDLSAVGIMMVDVDTFKAINDSHGHAAGDTVLRALAEEMGIVLRSYDSLGRYGGEEFLVVAPGCGMPETIELAERIRSHVAEKAVMANHGPIPVTISIGVTASRGEVFVAEQLLQEADTALYRAKGSGRNRVEAFTETSGTMETKTSVAAANH